MSFNIFKYITEAKPVKCFMCRKELISSATGKLHYDGHTLPETPGPYTGQIPWTCSSTCREQLWWAIFCAIIFVALIGAAVYGAIVPPKIEAMRFKIYYNEGRIAAEAEVPAAACPYNHEKEREPWLKGWIAANVERTKGTK